MPSPESRIMFLERTESATRQGLQSALPWRYVLYIVGSFECGDPMYSSGHCELRAQRLTSFFKTNGFLKAWGEGGISTSFQIKCLSDLLGKNLFIISSHSSQGNPMDRPPLGA